MQSSSSPTLERFCAGVAILGLTRVRTDDHCDGAFLFAAADILADEDPEVGLPDIYDLLDGKRDDVLGHDTSAEELLS